MDTFKQAQELIDTIIDNLHDDRWTLRLCSRVCHSWLPRSQQHLFRHIVLLPPCRRYNSRPTDVPYSKRLHKVLFASPRIADYIQEVKVYEGQGFREQDWISKDQTLPLVVRMLPKLKKIEFRRLYWNTLAADLRQSIRFVLELPSMESLEIKKGRFASMDDFARFLYHAKGLTGLSLGDINLQWDPADYDQEEIEEGVDSLQKGHLVNLNLKKFSESRLFIDWLLGPRSHFVVSKIHTLDVSDPCDGNALNSLLLAIGNSLRHCKFEPLRNEWDPSKFGYSAVNLNLEFNSGIRILHLVLSLSELQSPGSLSCLPPLSSIIQDLNQLEEIRLDIHSSSSQEGSNNGLVSLGRC